MSTTFYVLNEYTAVHFIHFHKQKVSILILYNTSRSEKLEVLKITDKMPDNVSNKANYTKMFDFILYQYIPVTMYI